MAGQSKLTRQLIEQGLEPLRRQYGHGPVRAMAAADGYVMCRRPGCMPFVLPQEQWLRLPEQERAA